MVVSIVEFNILKPVALEEANKIFTSTAPKYQQIKGLLSKNYICSEDYKTLGGIYFWESKQDALNLYTPEWFDFVIKKYGVKPKISYFINPIVVDNISKTIVNNI